MAKDRSKQNEQSEAEKAERRARNAANRARREAKAAAKEARKAKKGKPPQKQKPPGKSRKPAETDAIVAPFAEISPQIIPLQSPADISDKFPINPEHFNILLVVQGGRLECEAALFVKSLRQNAPGWQGRLILAEPRPEGAWAGHTIGISAAARTILEGRGAEIIPFTAQHFGASYPYGNKIEALQTLPAEHDFMFFDSDTLITGPIEQMGIDFSRPAASMRREGSWPQPPLYGPDYSDIWKALYERFGLDFESSTDLSQPDEHWERYLYFNAGWFFGSDPAEFGQRFLDWAIAVRDDPGDALASQELDPWLDQIILPLVIHSLGGGRPGPELDGLDGQISCHWRKLPLLYARESDTAVEALERAATAPDIQALLRGWEPALRLIYQGHGRNALRPTIDRKRLPHREQPLRKQIKQAGWWVV